MKSIIRKVFGALRLYRFGIVSLILNRLLSRVFRYKTIIVYSFDLRAEHSDTLYPTGQVIIKRADRPREELFKRFHERCPRREFVARFKKDNKDLYLALDEGEIAGYAWITYDEFYINEINYAYPLRTDEFFIYDCFVAPKCRGKGIYPAMLRKILRDYSEDSRYNLAYIGVSSANRGSVRGIEKARFKEYNRIRYVKWLNKERWWGVERHISGIKKESLL